MVARSMEHVEVAVVGAGSVGIAVAYYLVSHHGVHRIALIDSRDPMSLTSAQSGENYRNWWPHPVMTAFTDHSTALMEQLDRDSGGRLNMTRGGYSLVTRRPHPQDLIEALFRGYGDAPERIRLRESAGDYQPPSRAPWDRAPDGVDVLLNRALIRKSFPDYAEDVATVIHIRRAGSISAQQMGQFMLEALRQKGVRARRAQVLEIGGSSPFALELSSDQGRSTLQADRLVNAAGPFVQDIARMLGEELPVQCVYQQKIAFADRGGAISRHMPFTIDLDSQQLQWSDEDRELLAADPATRKLVEPMAGGIHCRPDGPVDGAWIKLGWAYNQTPTDPHSVEPIDPHFPDIVLRAASRLHKGLAQYIGKLPRDAHHYGGYYTMTAENWPLIGPMRTPGAYAAAALSGYGSMAACATGSLAAAWVTGTALPEYAHMLSSARHADAVLMRSLFAAGSGSL
jgi:glycine/D-amino acid oxidase-like deaminating enzyme